MKRNSDKPSTKRSASRSVRPKHDTSDTPTVTPPRPTTVPPEALRTIPPLPSSALADALLSGDRITLTNEAELEAARHASALSTTPPRSPSIPSGRFSLLTLANAQTASQPPETMPEVTVRLPAAIPADQSTDPLQEMRERLSLGDYTGALQCAETVLAVHPSHTEALDCSRECQAVLMKMYSARLGSLDRVPVVSVAKNQLQWLSIDHRAGFILSLVDGSMTLENIVDLSGMGKLDTLRILHELVQQRVIAFR